MEPPLLPDFELEDVKQSMKPNEKSLPLELELDLLPPLLPDLLVEEVCGRHGLGLETGDSVLSGGATGCGGSVGNSVGGIGGLLGLLVCKIERAREGRERVSVISR